MHEDKSDRIQGCKAGVNGQCLLVCIVRLKVDVDIRDEPSLAVILMIDIVYVSEIDMYPYLRLITLFPRPLLTDIIAHYIKTTKS